MESIKTQLDKILLKVQRPARYVGGELNSVVKQHDKVDFRFAFCFPDTYEVGMSHLGMKILYSQLNEMDGVWCERVFAPESDMEKLMRENHIPLYGLESMDPIANFDMIGFTLQYEMSFTAVLNMLDLAGVPVRSENRDSLAPLVVAGGPCTCNPEPIADFIDLFMLGEGEEVLPELVNAYRKAKAEGLSKAEFLKIAAHIQGVYVPSLYEFSYNEDSTIKEITPHEGAPAVVTKRIIKDLDKVYFPKEFIVPFVEPVHDRSMVEVLRGCIRGCRFCQAGFIYRPFREKSPETLNKNGWDLTCSTGYDEISLSSLSTSDYSGLEELLDKMLVWTDKEQVNLSLPSLRVDNFSEKLLEQIAKVRKSGLTFAPEAGTQRMRDVINKNVTEEEVIRTCTTAFQGGYTAVKLYFMLGLPTETNEDLAGIVDLAQKVVDLYYALPNKPKGRGVTVSVSLAGFVPKPFTPFQFEPQATMAELQEKQKYLLSCVTSRKINVKYHDSKTSVLEGVFARGDRRLCSVLETAWRSGCNLDGWDNHFKYENWMQAFEACGVDPTFYANRTRSYDEVMPWDHLDYGVTKRFLIEENKKAHADAVTPHCRLKCSACGANKLSGGCNF
ncbi:TIGR03960 family B12-binding radical SAM protein [Hydrogenoanaerobacterium sp.]|uniref:TIGR03960 family B12-binding radical SAM protein n=1 Tax=Hydrogenoanaerobacterium sp. TaxID=2953763 RepID=UPI002899EA15|nr:TIGR03960 family B12-binding radical SAM protein [Hydrogenoanaerobacterium sp.]